MHAMRHTVRAGGAVADIVHRLSASVLQKSHDHVTLAPKRRATERVHTHKEHKSTKKCNKPEDDQYLDQGKPLSAFSEKKC